MSKILYSSLMKIRGIKIVDVIIVTILWKFIK